MMAWVTLKEEALALFLDSEPLELAASDVCAVLTLTAVLEMISLFWILYIESGTGSVFSASDSGTPFLSFLYN